MHIPHNMRELNSCSTATERVTPQPPSRSLQAICSIFSLESFGQECHPELQFCVPNGKCDPCFDSVVESVVSRRASRGYMGWFGWPTS